jgi:hypothetical protein
VLVCATVFVLAAVGAGILALTGDDSGPAASSTTAADSVFPAIPAETTTTPDRDNGGESSPDAGGSGSDGGETSSKPEGSSGNGGPSDASQPASEVKCPRYYGREQCELLKQAWKSRESNPLEVGKKAKCPYDREQCKALKQAWKSRESNPLETGGNPEDVECPYDREQCKLLWEAWQAAAQ